MRKLFSNKSPERADMNRVKEIRAMHRARLDVTGYVRSREGRQAFAKAAYAVADEDDEIRKAIKGASEIPIKNMGQQSWTELLSKLGTLLTVFSKDEVRRMGR
jgi:hypothetical protein